MFEFFTKIYAYFKRKLEWETSYDDRIFGFFVQLKDKETTEESDLTIFSQLVDEFAFLLDGAQKNEVLNNNPLIYLAKFNIKNCAEFLRILHEKNFNFALQEVPDEDDFDNTALVWAAANASNEFCAEFLEFISQNNIGAGVNINCGPSAVTALHLLVAKGYDYVDAQGNKLEISNLELIETLVRNGANPNLGNKKLYTALDVAVARRDSDTISAILPFCNQETIAKALKTLKNNFNDSQEIVNSNLGDSSDFKKPLDESLFNKEFEEEIEKILKEKLNKFTKPTSSKKLIEDGEKLEMQSSC